MNAPAAILKMHLPKTDQLALMIKLFTFKRGGVEGRNTGQV